MPETATQDWAPLKPERHAIPTDPGALLQYLRQHPLTDVKVVHRGGPTIYDKYDGAMWVIPPGNHKMPFAVARHFQRRHFLTGTRVFDNRHGLKAESVLGLPDIDPPQRVRAFTAEELERAGHSVEGLNRAALDPSARKKRVMTEDEVKKALANARYSEGEDAEDPEAAIEKAVAAAESAPEPIPEGKHGGLAQVESARAQRGKK